MTKIFKNRIEFLQRLDKLVNGVSEEFAQDYPDFEKENKTNDGCWNCSDCSGCSGCFGCFGCSGCSGLENAAPVQQKENPDAGFKVPIIENIHQKILAVASKPDAFDMTQFHACETTHFRAGWVIHLAGAPGYELEKKTSSVFAAIQIYHKSCPDIPVSPVRFFEDNETAMKDIEKCAEEEKVSSK